MYAIGVEIMRKSLGHRRAARGLDREAGPLPGGKATQQGSHVGKTFVHQHLRHTGAGLLLPSGAIQDQLFVAGQLAQPRPYLAFGE